MPRRRSQSEAATSATSKTIDVSRYSACCVSLGLTGSSGRSLCAGNIKLSVADGKPFFNSKYADGSAMSFSLASGDGSLVADGFLINTLGINEVKVDVSSISGTGASLAIDFTVS